MKYDDAEYCFLNFETDLDNNAASTHIGMFLGWCVLRGLGRDAPSDEHWTREVARLKRREITGGELLTHQCDCKLTDGDLSDEGNAFAQAYYEAQFVKDYEAVLRDQMPGTGHDTDDFCSVPDTWQNFDRLAPVLDRRFAEWKAKTRRAPARDLGLEPLQGGAPAGDEAIEALKRRAATGDGQAWYELGAEYITGKNTPRDFSKAADAFEKAAQLGVMEAAFNLAVCYQNGDGRPADPKQMLRWFALAAEGGHGQAAYFLAMAYRQGRFVQQDFVASNALMLIAQARGVKAAAEAGVMAGSLKESAALAEQLSAQGQLVSVLSARRRALAQGKVDDGTARWRDPAGSASPASPATSTGQSTGERGGIDLATVALFIGAVALVPLLMVAGSITGSRMRVLAFSLSFVGAVGVFIVSGRQGKPLVVRALLTVLATFPFIGSFACVLVAWGWLRRRSA